jgi:hypothetical protein
MLEHDMLHIGCSHTEWCHHHWGYPDDILFCITLRKKQHKEWDVSHSKTGMSKGIVSSFCNTPTWLPCCIRSKLQSTSEQTDSISIQSPMHSLPKALQFPDHLIQLSQAPWKNPNCCFPTLTLILQYPFSDKNFNIKNSSCQMMALRRKVGSIFTCLCILFQNYCNFPIT